MNPHTTSDQDAAEVSVLIVEDDDWQVEGIKSDLDNLLDEKGADSGISRFAVQVAGSLAEAEKLFAATKDKPFDLLFLDLSLPPRKGSREESPENGFKILEIVRTREVAKEVLVISRFSEYKNVRRAFQGGALDFLDKPFESADLQERVQECWRRVLAKESDKILRQRIQKLVPYDETKLAHDFSGQFSRFTQNVIDEADEIERELSERLQLDARRDRQDSLLRHLAALREVVRTAKQEWTEALTTLSVLGEGTRKYPVGELLRQIKDELLPCLKVKKVELQIRQNEQPYILSFQDDVRAVLKEIVAGALAELPDFGDRTEINATVAQTGEYAKVRFSGDSIRVKPQVAQALKSGAPRQRGDIGQEWGLFIAQHIASRGGGRLQVGGDEHPDSITYLIPLANHA